MALQFRFMCLGLLVCAALICTVNVAPAYCQAPQGPMRITLDEAIQLALQHNHNMIAARTAIDQSLAQGKITANPAPQSQSRWRLGISAVFFAERHE